MSPLPQDGTNLPAELIGFASDWSWTTDASELQMTIPEVVELRFKSLHPKIRDAVQLIHDELEKSLVTRMSSFEFKCVRYMSTVVCVCGGGTGAEWWGSLPVFSGSLIFPAAFGVCLGTESAQGES